jgi:hypothetical protein
VKKQIHDIIATITLGFRGYYMDLIAVELFPLGEPPDMADYIMSRFASHDIIATITLGLSWLS